MDLASENGTPNEHPRKACGAETKEEMADTRLQCIKVVAVDDNADTRALLKVILKLSSAEAAVVGSGQEALRAIKQVHPDVLICDLAMPEMDGYQLLENVRRLEPEFRGLSAIAFTAASSNEDRAATKRAGFQAHLL